MPEGVPSKSPEGGGTPLDLPAPPKDEDEGLEVGGQCWYQSDGGNFCNVTLMAVDRASHPHVYTVDVGGGDFVNCERARLFQVKPNPRDSGQLAAVPDFDELESRLARLKGQ
uniref:Uncharacterized protein n=1 Tax=Hemiselmis tepida TaxID=464990 RepID=A0A7S0YW00_9CRYP